MTTELKSFEEIKQISETGNEFWSVRNLQEPLGYEKWEFFSKVIDKAMLACDTADFEVKDHFPVVKKMVEMPTKTHKNVEEIGFPDIGKTKNITDYYLVYYTHFTVGKEVRETIMRLGGVMPENLPTPEKGIIELEKEVIKKLKEKK